MRALVSFARLALLVLVAAAGAARAQVSCSLTSDTSAPLVGGTFTTTTALGRNTAGTGYAPALEVFVPAGLTLTQASVLGQTMPLQTVGTFGTTLTNPLTLETVSGPAGFTLVLARLPFGGLPQGAGPQTVTLTWSVSTTATPGTALTPQVTCLFAFGQNDALNNAATDAPPRSDSRTSGSDQLGVTVTPTLARLSKTVSPNPTVTGPDFPVSYTLTLDVANGRFLDGGSMTDTLPSQFQLVSITPSAGGTVISPTSIPSTPGGSLSVRFPTVTGTAAANDATVTVTGYVPRADASDAGILSTTCVGGSTASISNTANFVNALSGATPVTVSPATVAMTARAEQVREVITNVTTGGSNFRPGEAGRVTLTVSASDYFALTNVALASVVGAGAHYTGNALVDGSPALPTVSADFRTLGFSLGSLAAGSTHLVSWDFIVDEAYSTTPGDLVRGGDVISTSHTLTSTAPTGCTLTSTEVQGGSDRSITIGAATLSKTLLAINGVTPTSGASVRPGDVVTWRIALTQRSGDLSGVTLTDYLPRPIFDAQEHGATPTFGSGSFRFGAGNTLPSGTPVTLTTTSKTTDNSLVITVGAFSQDPTADVTMVFDFDFTVSSEPREDGLGFTNLVSAVMKGSGSTSVSTSASTPFNAGDPAVTIYKGPMQVSSTAGGTAKTTGITLTNPYTAATYTSTTLATLTATASSVAGVDGADVITYRLIAENKGSTAAYNVQLGDVPPTGLTCDTAPQSITNGAGTALAFTTITVSGGVGWQLTNPLPGYDATSGNNLAVVTVRCTVASSGWTPNATVSNTARIINFASIDGGPNFAPSNYVPNSRTSNVRFANFAITKARTDAVLPVTRDTLGYALTLAVPEGQFANISLVDTFPTRLALGASAGPTLLLPAGVTIDGSTTPTINAGGTTVTWTLGTVTNSRSDDAVETSASTALTAVVLNNTSTAGVNALALRQVSSNLVSVNAGTVTFRAPTLTLTQSVSPNPVAGGASPTVTATITNGNATADAIAYDVEYQLVAPSGCTNPSSVVVSGGTGESHSVVGNTVTVDFTSIARNSTATITFTCSVPAQAVIGSSVVLPGTLAWTSQPGTPAQLGPNTAAVEASSSTSANTTLNISPLTLSKTRVGTGTVVVGQAVDFDLALTVPVGTTNVPLTLTDAMVDGLVFGSTSNFTAGANLTCGGATCALPTPTLTNSNRTAMWNLGTVTNAGSTAQALSFRVRTYVTNTAAAARGATLTNTFDAGVPVASSSVTIAEPALSFTAALSPDAGNAGDVSTLNVTLTNSTLTNANLSAAQDVGVTFALPADVEVVSGSYVSTDCPTPVAQALSGATPSVAFGSIAATTTCTFGIGVKLRDTVTLPSTLNIGVAVLWSSLPGDVTAAQTPNSAVSTERTGDLANPGGALNTYAQQLTVPWAAVQTADITKTLVSTDSTQTADPDIALGELATWRLKVRVGEGISKAVSVVETPPAALQLISVALDTTGFPGVVASDPSATLALDAGTATTFTLGDINNPGDNDPSNDFVTLVVTGRPTLHPSLTATGQNNAVSLRSNSTELDPDSLAVSYALPKLRVTQSVSPTQPAAGATVTGSTTLANQGNGPACAPSVVVTAPAGFSFVDPGSDGLDNDQNGTVDDAAEAGFLSGQVLTVPYGGCIAGSASVSLPWKLVTAAAVPPGDVTLTSALEPYRSLPAPDGVALSATTDLFDNDGDGQLDETNDGQVSLTLSPVAPALAITKSFLDVNGGTPSPGDVLEWRVTVQNTGTGTSSALTLSDTLPTTSASVVSGSATTTQGTALVTGSLLNVDVGALDAGASVTVTVRQQLNSALTAQTSLSNQANLATGDAYGPRVSDDPSTAAVDDATVAVVSGGTTTPVITAPANNSVTSDTTPAVSGTAAPGATVTVYFDGSSTPACTAVADSVTGAWECTPTTALAEGSHTVTAQAQTSTGTSLLSQPNTFTVDTSAPVVVITAPATGSITSDATPAVSGTTEPGATVTVFLDGASTAYCTVTADTSTGEWSCPDTATLADGPHVVTAVATDAAGNASQPTTNSFTVDTTAPAVPVITAPTEGATTSPTPTFAGLAEPRSTVTLFVDGSTTPICTATADDDGNFACVASTALSVGAHTVIAIATDAAGNSTDSDVRNFNVEPAVPPGPPTLTTPVDGAHTTDTTPAFAGDAAPGSTVKVYVDGGATPVCTATADADGHFTCTPATPLPEGPHTAVATASNAYGTSAQSNVVDFSIDSVAPTAPVITSPAPNATTNLHPTYTGTAEPGATVDVYLDGGTTPVCTATADVNGQWACTGATALTPGAHVVTAHATDGAGNVSPDATPHPFTAQADLPVAVITSPAADEVLGTATPDFTGTATPGASISVYVDGSSTPACVTVADDQGHFACRGGALSDGTHDVTVTATNQEGTSAPGTPVPFVIDTHAPDAPTVTTPADGSITNTRPTYEGTAEAGSTVTVRVDGFVVCVVQASATGAWSCSSVTELTAGTHTVNATSTDAAGNRSATSATNTFEVRLPVPPEADPTLTGPAEGALTTERPTFTGTGEPGATIDVLVDGVVVCTATVDTSGAWTCTATSDLSAGTHGAIARQTDQGTRQTSEVHFIVAVKPVVTSPGEGALLHDNHVTFTGTATPNSAVEVRVDGELVCTTTADATGQFSCTAAQPLSEGTHTVVATSAGRDSDPVGFRVGELDLNGDGLVDGTELTGGGCAAAPTGLWLLGAVGWLLRRRRR